MMPVELTIRGCYDYLRFTSEGFLIIEVAKQVLVDEDIRVGGSLCVKADQ
jgi:hypothetical protein